MAELTMQAIEITFPDGLVGCPDWRRFTLERRAEMAPIVLLHSADVPGLSLIAADPRVWVPDYDVDLPAADGEALGLPGASEAVILAILNVEAEPFAVSANLLGPLVINPANSQGRQVIQSARPYLAQQPLATPGEPLHFAEGWVGCPDWQRFVLRRTPEAEPFSLLASLDHPDLALPVVDPWLIDAAFAPRLGEADRAALGLADDSDLAWLVVLSIQHEPLLVTANMLGPLAYHRRTGAARQVILSQAGYSAAHRVAADEQNSASEVKHAGAHPTA